MPDKSNAQHSAHQLSNGASSGLSGNAGASSNMADDDEENDVIMNSDDENDDEYDAYSEQQKSRGRGHSHDLTPQSSESMAASSNDDCNTNAVKKNVKKRAPAPRGRSSTRAKKGKVGRPRKLPGRDDCGGAIDVKMKNDDTMHVKIKGEVTEAHSKKKGKRCTSKPARSRRCTRSRSKRSSQSSRRKSRKRSRSSSSSYSSSISSGGSSRSSSSSSRYRITPCPSRAGRSRAKDRQSNYSSSNSRKSSIAFKEDLSSKNSSRERVSGAMEAVKGFAGRVSRALNSAEEEEDEERRDKKTSKEQREHKKSKKSSKTTKKSSSKRRSHHGESFLMCRVM